MAAIYIWIIVGLLLMLSEFVIPGFIIFFFGAAAIIVGILQALVPGVPLPAWIIACCILGAVLLLLCRRFMPKYMTGTRMTGSCETDVDNDGVIGEKVTVVEAISVGQPGKVELHGTLWNAVAEKDISNGEIVVVKGKKNLTLTVEPFNK